MNKKLFKNIIRDVYKSALKYIKKCFMIYMSMVVTFNVL